MGKVEITSISKDELELVKREIFNKANAKDNTSESFCDEAGDILRKLSIEEIATLINGFNYSYCGMIANLFVEDAVDKVHAAQDLYAKREVESFIANYNSGKAVEYFVGKTASDISMLKCFLIGAAEEQENFDTSNFDNYFAFLDEITSGFKKYDYYFNGRPNYDTLKKAAVKCGYYNYAVVDDDEICDYLIEENGARNKFDIAVLSGGQGFKEIEKTESIDNKVMMAVDFAVNYAKTEGFLYDEALDLFVDDFLNTEILDSSILGMPVRQVIKEMAPYVYFYFSERNNVPYEQFSNRGYLVKLNLLSEMFTQNVEEKRESLIPSVTADTK